MAQPDASTLRIEIHDDLGRVDPREWDRLGLRGSPFLRHAFLRALETEDCLEPWGWYPRHILIREGGRLVAACPLYLKTNSYGEFVFDWSWAATWERLGRDYYPKLVCAIPYTPASGPRLLIDPDHPDPDGLRRLLVRTARELAAEFGCSGVHWLFTRPEETRLLHDTGMTLRLGCQYHWHNPGYRDFDDFLSRLSSKKRKNIRRERRRVAEQGLALRRLNGAQAGEAEWSAFHAFYRNTFETKAGIPTLTRGFFLRLAEQMPESLLLVLAEREGRLVAGALNLVGRDTLYGRYWGCSEEYDHLHFEACFYQGIEFAIARGLKRFEPGAQGEHKIPRGFLPTPTWSAHWIRDDGMRPLIERFCRHEQEMMREHCRDLFSLSPFRADALPPDQRPETLEFLP